MLLVVLIGFYLAVWLVTWPLVFAKNWFWVRVAQVAAPALLCGVILVDRAGAIPGDFDFSGFDDLALMLVLPWLGLALMAFWVVRWRWLFWLVFGLNALVGCGMGYMAAMGV